MPESTKKENEIEVRFEGIMAQKFSELMKDTKPHIQKKKKTQKQKTQVGGKKKIF
jgi:hypothetical protein